MTNLAKRRFYIERANYSEGPWELVEINTTGTVTPTEYDTPYWYRVRVVIGPRKPREWWITLDAGDITGVVTKALTSALWTARDNAKVIHVIEWPEGAPLPEWPE